MISDELLAAWLIFRLMKCDCIVANLLEILLNCFAEIVQNNIEFEFLKLSTRHI